MLVIQFIRFNKYVRNAGFLSAVLLFILSSLTILPLSHHEEHTEATTGTATESTLSLDITSAAASVNLTTTNVNGNFVASSQNEVISFGVDTNNYTGYTLSISAADNTGELVNGEESLDTISSSLTASQFDVIANNGKWGYKPSKYRSGNTTVDNTGNNAVFLTSPTTSGTTLDITSSSNDESNSYTIALGARADYTKPAGSYTKTFTLTTVANPINYSVTYNKNTEDTVTNMPYSSTNNTQSGAVDNTNITLSNLVPIRSGYAFKGWCSTSTNDATCSGTIYNPNGAGTNLSYGIDQTVSNTATLYAMWQPAETQCDNTKLCVQYEGNGLTYDGKTVNRVNYDSVTVHAGGTKYAHMSNVGDDGIATGYITSVSSGTINDTQTVTIDGAETLKVTVYYDTYVSSSYGYVSVYKSPFNISTSNDYSTSSSTGNISGMLYGYNSNNRNTSYTTWNSRTFTVAGDTVKFHFYRGYTSSFSNNYYGYYAVVTSEPILNRTVSSGNYTTPSGENGTFYGWSTTQVTAGEGMPSLVEYADESEIKAKFSGNNGDTKTLYAVWQRAYPVSFTMDSYTSSVDVSDAQGNSIGTVSNNGESVMLLYGETYNISPNHSNGYGTNSIVLSSGSGSLSGDKLTSKQFTVGSGSATISITSKSLQQIQNYNCANLSNVGDVIQLYDSRDGEVYVVGKLADNKCWLLDNLRLDLTKSSVISNTTESNTNASSTMLGYLKNGGGSATDNYPTAGLTGSNWTSSSSYSAPLVNVSGTTNNSEYTKNTILSKSYGVGSGKVGAYYNYCAASAGSYCYSGDEAAPSTDPNTDAEYDINGDICPKGWRIPTGGEAGEYQSLGDSYNSTTATDSSSLQYNFSTPLSGYYYGTSASNQNSYGNFWSSTFYSDRGMNDLYVGNTSAGPQSYEYRHYGLSVRCIAMTNNTYSLNFNKNTSDTVSGMPSNQSVTIRKDINYIFDIPTSSIPSRSGYVFVGWGTTNDQVTPTYKYDNGSFTPSSVIVPEDDNVETLYAIWYQPQTITFTWDSNVTSVDIFDPDDEIVATLTTSGSSTTLYNPVTYRIKPSHTSGYTTNNISKTTGAGTIVNKMFTVGAGAATINITSKTTQQMQNFNCSNLAKGDYEYVYDNRDNEVYLIGKLEDNKCWLLDNLRLNLNNSSILDSLSSSNTNISANNESTILTSLKNGNRSAGNQYATSGIGNLSSGNSYSQARINTAYNNSSAPISYGIGSKKRGTFYNYCAASAGSYCYGNGANDEGEAVGNAISDICPAGWRLPTGGETGEYKTLYDAYNNDDPSSHASIQYNLSTPLAGVYYYGRLNDYEDVAFWSSTNMPSINMHVYVFLANKTKAEPTLYDGRDMGHPVRCVNSEKYSITFTFGSTVSAVDILEPGGTVVDTLTSSGASAALEKGTTYTIAPIFVAGYTTNTISKTSGAGTLNNNQFTVGTGAATINITSKTMQQIQNFNCSSLAKGSTEYVYDNRDNERYLIGKLADNRCWLLDNLRLDLSDSNVLNSLSSANTNILSSDATAILTSLKTGNRAAGDQYANDVIEEEGSLTYSAARIISYNKDIIPVPRWEELTHFGPGSGKRGAYYNYCAATAGSYCYGDGYSDYGSPPSGENTTSDICPAGWRLPTGGYSNSEYQTLIESYDEEIEDPEDPSSVMYNFSGVLAGYYSDYNGDNYLFHDVTFGYYWTSTPEDYNDYIYSAIMQEISLGYHYSKRSDSLSIRCIRK